MAALLACPTQEQAAQAAGISTRTIRDYLQDPVFCREYERRRQELVISATAQLQQSLAAAVAALRDIVGSEQSSDSARIAAARILLDHGLKYTELCDLIQRMEAVESIVREARL